MLSFCKIMQSGDWLKFPYTYICVCMCTGGATADDVAGAEEEPHRECSFI